MTQTVNTEWDLWQAAWRSDPGAPAASPSAAPGAAAEVAPVAASAAFEVSTTAEMQRRLVRARRMAWLAISMDISVSVLFVAFGVFALTRSRALPVVVWAITLFGFTALALGFAIWNRRDALTFSTATTADFAAALYLRLARRERVPRFVAWFLTGEIGTGLVIHAVWYPRSLVRAGALYALSVLVIALWSWRYRKRVRRERAQLDALVGDSVEHA